MNPAQERDRAETAPPRAGRSPRRLARAAGLVAAAACAAEAVRRVDLPAVGASLTGARHAFVALAVGANLASLAAHAARWRSVVHSPGRRVRWRDALAALVGGFAAGIVLPARGGDVVRAHLLARRAGLSTAQVLVASGLDYVVGAVALVAVVAAAAAAAPLPAWAARGLAVLAVLAVAGALAAWFLRPRRAAAPIPGVAGLLARLRAGLGAIEEPRALAWGLSWAVAGWAAEAAVALATLAALGLPATVGAAVLAVLAASAASAVPLAPGNAGSFELATAVALAGTGAPPAALLAFAVAFHLVHLVPVSVIGGAVLVRDAIRRRA